MKNGVMIFVVIFILVCMLGAFLLFDSGHWFGGLCFLVIAGSANYKEVKDGKGDISINKEIPKNEP